MANCVVSIMETEIDPLPSDTEPTNGDGLEAAVNDLKGVVDRDRAAVEVNPEQDALQTLHNIENLLANLTSLLGAKQEPEVPGEEPNLEVPEPTPDDMAEIEPEEGGEGPAKLKV